MQTTSNVAQQEKRPEHMVTKELILSKTAHVLQTMWFC